MKYYFAKSLLWLLSFLPLGSIQFLGSVIGRLSFRFSKRTTTRLKDNLLKSRVATKANIDELSFQTAKESGKTMAEALFLAWQRSKVYIAKSFSVETVNLDLLQQAVLDKRPIVCLTPHVGNFEIALKYTALVVDQQFTVLYKPSKAKWLNKLMLNGRTENNIRPVPTTRYGIVELVKALKRKEIIGILPDSIASSGEGVWVKFFGQDVFATTLAAKMMQFKDAVIFIVGSKRLAHGKFVINYLPYTLKSDNLQEIVQDTYKVFEQLILEAPDQFYWSYDRFRTPKHAASKI